MNFKDLAERLHAIEKGSNTLNNDGLPVEECGDMPTPAMASIEHEKPSQPDNVTMNVSMNGSGAGGISDLMKILRNIEAGEEELAAEPEIAEPHELGDIDGVLAGEELKVQEAGEETVVGHDVDHDKDHSIANRPDRTTYNIDTITRHGDDIHSKGDVKRLKVNGGENPLQEGLVSKLMDHYNQVKSRSLVENVTTDHAGSTFEHICNTFKRDVADFRATGEVSRHLHDALFDYYFDDIPYGVKKARDGDPYEWVAERFGHDLGIDEGFMSSVGNAIGSAVGGVVGGVKDAVAGASQGYNKAATGTAPTASAQPAPNPAAAAARAASAARAAQIEKEW